jgi:hypothetical protein
MADHRNRLSRLQARGFMGFCSRLMMISQKAAVKQDDDDEVGKAQRPYCLFALSVSVS